MTYDKWADEYVESARLTMCEIEKTIAKIKKTRNNTSLLCMLNKRLTTLYDMYYDCMYVADRLRVKASKCR